MRDPIVRSKFDIISRLRRMNDAIVARFESARFYATNTRDLLSESCVPLSDHGGKGGRRASESQEQAAV